MVLFSWHCNADAHAYVLTEQISRWNIYLLSACRSAVAQALPQLQLLDRLPLDDERKFLAQQQGPAAQHVAELQLQAYQPQTEAEQSPAALLMPEAAARGREQTHPWPGPMAYLQGVTPVPEGLTYMQCMQQLPSLPRAPGLSEAVAHDDVQNLADRLAQRLAQARATLPDEAAADSAKQEQRLASMEARLSALLEGRLLLPDQAPRQAGCGNGCSHETHLNRAGASDTREGGASQRQQPVRPHSRFSGVEIAPSAVQHLQVESSCPVHMGVTTVTHCKTLAIAGHPYVMVCLRQVTSPVADARLSGYG